MSGLGDYVSHALRTESRPDKLMLRRHADSIRLDHAAKGMVTEAGEFTDALKKHVFYNRPLDRLNLVEELGDLLWYVAIACDALGVTLEDVCEANLRKLRSRYPEKFTEELAATRNIESEMEAMLRSGPLAKPRR